MRPSLYRTACEALMGPKGGELIDPDPDSANDSRGVKRERLRRTRVGIKEGNTIEVHRIQAGC